MSNKSLIRNYPFKKGCKMSPFAINNIHNVCGFCYNNFTKLTQAFNKVALRLIYFPSILCIRTISIRKEC